MKLTYRGVSYDYNPPVVETKLTEDSGSYRGVDIRFRTVTKAPVQQTNLDLIYRGVRYQTGQAQVAAPEIAAEPAVATPAMAMAADDRARVMMMNHHRVVKRRQQSMLGRLASEVGLPASAANYWGHIQGKVNPSFWATYDRSHATLS